MQLLLIVSFLKKTHGRDDDDGENDDGDDDDQEEEEEEETLFLSYHTMAYTTFKNNYVIHKSPSRSFLFLCYCNK